MPMLCSVGPFASFRFASNSFFQTSPAHLRVVDAGPAVARACGVAGWAPGRVPEALQVAAGDVQASEPWGALEGFSWASGNLGLLWDQGQRLGELSHRLLAGHRLPGRTLEGREKLAVPAGALIVPANRLDHEHALGVSDDLFRREAADTKEDTWAPPCLELVPCTASILNLLST